MINRLVPLVAAIGGAVLAMVLAPAAAWAEKRVALVVGNASYQTVPQLPNPARDASAVAKLFRDAGFETVETQINVGNLDFKRAIRRFEATADQADIAVVYYAGHGLEIGGTNYLIPVDARLASDRDAEDEAIPLERLVSSADGARRLRLIILDACRDNPFTTTMRRERKAANRAVVGGLGKVEPTSTDTLIAYAAKAGSTADDGAGEHSPFTTAVLRNLTVPGLDVRLAFGRVRDEVLKATGNRQEPFVYGSLGGGNISLVAPPATRQEAAVSDVKADYDLVQKIGSKRAWEVFLGTHPTGFYADLARAQIEAINAETAKTQLAALPQPPAASRETPTREALEWDRVKDSTDIAALQRFIKRFPDSPLAINAQQRVDLLNKAVQEREEQARAARKAVEEAQRLAEARKAELAAQKKREDDERRAREAEAAEKARAAAAEAAAARKREDDERRAQALEAEQKARAAEAERKAAEAKARAEQAERDRQAAEAAAQKGVAEKQAKAAEDAARAKAFEAERKAAEEKRKAEAEAAAARAAVEKQAREAEEARKKAELAAAKEANCKSEQGRLEAITARGSDGTGLDDLKAFARSVTCDRLGGLVVAALDKFKAEATRRAATQPNSPELIRSAQAELIRLGCLTGKIDGTLNPATSTALSRYMKIEGLPTENVKVTEVLVTELGKHKTRVCPIECKAGETLKGETCVADEKTAPAVAAKPKNDEDDAASRRKQQAARPSERTKPVAEPVAPRAKQQAVAKPSIVSGGRSHSTMIGVGF